VPYLLQLRQVLLAVKNKRSLKVAITTLGCKVNFFDSAAMGQSLRGGGFEVLPFPASADIYIINTCTVTESTDAQSRQLIRRALRMNPDAPVIVTGCYAQHSADAVAAISDRLHILGNREKGDILTYLRNITAGSQRIVSVSDIACVTNLSAPALPSSFNRTRAFLKIQDGCNAACSYCIVPSVRGSSRSIPLEDAIENITSLARSGFREIVLTGIHMGAYGLDLAPQKSLIDLLQHLSSDEMLSGVRIRLSSIEPNEITDELIDFISRSDLVCPHFHIPLQSGDEIILKSMNRGYTPAGFKYIIEKLASSIPDLNIGVDVIAGFPGETEAHFQNTLRFIQDLPVGYLHVFPYSRRPGTPAALMPDHVPERIKKQRTAILREISLNKKKRFYASFLNKLLPVLVEGKRNQKTQHLKGFSRNYIPVLIEGPDELMGNEIMVRVVDVQETSVYGEKE
jgi:threonylcarbamoyladenosine tRNA methylthiotransferase MtaB